MRRSLLALTAAAALALTGCTADQDPTPLDQPETPPDDPVPTAEVEEPNGGCADLPWNDSGLYTVGEAGEVELSLEADRLIVWEVEPAEGWTHEVPAGEGPQIEVRFTGDDDGEAVVLRGMVAEGDVGLAQLEVCAEGA